MSRFYVLMILFGIGVTFSAWLKLRNDRSAGRTSPLEQAFPRFMIFFGAGILILMGIIWVIDNFTDYVIDARHLTGLAIILALPIYFVTRKLEPRNKKIFERRSSIIAIVFILPLIFYWALIEGLDPVFIAPIAFICTLAAIVLLSRSWGKD
jgi:hypothetical protein